MNDEPTTEFDMEAFLEALNSQEAQMKLNESQIDTVCEALMSATEPFEGYETENVMRGVAHFYAFLIATLASDTAFWVELVNQVVPLMQNKMAESAEAQSGTN
jgi:hypothetical protein